MTNIERQPIPENNNPSIENPLGLLLQHIDLYEKLGPDSQDKWWALEMEVKTIKDPLEAKIYVEKFIASAEKEAEGQTEH